MLDMLLGWTSSCKPPPSGVDPTTVDQSFWQRRRHVLTGGDVIVRRQWIAQCIYINKLKQHGPYVLTWSLQTWCPVTSQDKAVHVL